MWPILCSSDTTRRSLRAPGAPSPRGRYFGTTNSDMPRVPAGEPDVRASVRCTTFSLMSWSAWVMKIFVPAIFHAPLAGVARVVSAPTSEPAPGSVRFIAPDHSPVTSFGRYAAFMASSPCASMASMAPWVSISPSANAMFAACHISASAPDRVCPRPMPPQAGSAATAPQPASIHFA